MPLSIRGHSVIRWVFNQCFIRRESSPGSKPRLHWALQRGRSFGGLLQPGSPWQRPRQWSIRLPRILTNPRSQVRRKNRDPAVCPPCRPTIQKTRQGILFPTYPTTRANLPAMTGNGAEKANLAVMKGRGTIKTPRKVCIRTSTTRDLKALTGIGKIGTRSDGASTRMGAPSAKVGRKRCPQGKGVRPFHRCRCPVGRGCSVTRRHPFLPRMNGNNGAATECLKTRTHSSAPRP